MAYPSTNISIIIVTFLIATFFLALAFGTYHKVSKQLRRL